MKIKKGSWAVIIGLVIVCSLGLAEAVWGDIPTATVEKARDATVLVAVSYTHLTLPTNREV